MTLAVASGALRLQPVSETVRRESLGFEARAVLAWWVAEGDDDAPLGNHGGIGVSVPGGEGASTAWTAAPDDQSGWRGSDAASGLLALDGSGALTGSIVPDDDGFALALDGTPRSAWQVHYLALGGDALRGAAVRTVVLGERGATVDGLGFRPDLIVAIPSAEGRAGEARAGIGVASALDAQAVVSYAAGGTGPTLTRGPFRDDALVAVPRLDDAFDYAALARLASLDDDGFTLAVDEPPDAPVVLHVLAVSGGRYAVGTTRAATRRAGRATARTAVEPTALLTLTSGLDAMARVRDIARLCVGAATAAGPHGCVTWSARRGVDPPEPRTSFTRERVTEVLDTTSGELHAGAVPERVGDGGFTLRWPIADANPRDVAYVAFGSADAPPRRGLLRRVLGE